MQIGLFSRSGFCHALFVITTLLILGLIPKGGGRADIFRCCGPTI
jgi:hypothetical protein